MANTKGEKELRTSWEYPDKDIMNLIFTTRSVIPKKDKVGL